MSSEAFEHTLDDGREQRGLLSGDRTLGSRQERGMVYSSAQPPPWVRADASPSVFPQTSFLCSLYVCVQEGGP